MCPVKSADIWWMPNACTRIWFDFTAHPYARKAPEALPLRFRLNGGVLKGRAPRALRRKGGTVRVELLHLVLQIAHAMEQLGQLLQRDNLTLGLPVRRGRDPQYAPALRDVAHDARLG